MTHRQRIRAERFRRRRLRMSTILKRTQKYLRRTQGGTVAWERQAHPEERAR
jgi:hypothetical protein